MRYPSDMTIRNSEHAFYEATGARIRAARVARGLTQTELAASVGLTRTSVVNIEKGRQKMLVHTLHDFAAALGSVVADLLPPDDRVAGGYASRAALAKAKLSPEAEAFVRLALRKPKPVRRGSK